MSIYLTVIANINEDYDIIFDNKINNYSVFQANGYRLVFSEHTFEFMKSQRWVEWINS